MALKQFLLEYNPSKIKSDAVFKEFVSGFSELLNMFAHQTEGITDSSRLLIVDTFSIWILRSTQCLRNKKLDTTGYQLILREKLLTTNNSEIIFQYIVDFWTDGTSAFNNALRDLFTKFLRLLNIIYAAQECTALFHSWLIQILDISSTLRVQYYLINSLASQTDLYLVLQRRPDFIETCLSLMWSDALSNPIGKCVTSLLLNVYRIHFEEDESMLSEWLELWQTLVLARLRDPRYTKAIELYILMPIFRDMPNLTFVKFVDRCPSCDFSVLISIFRIGQELAIEEEPYHGDKLISLECIEQLLQQDEHKLYAFELLTFSVKTSRPVHSYIFDIVKRNLRIFFVDTNIETRNYFSSFFKHFLLRIRDSSYSLNRDRIKLTKAKKFPEEQVEKLNHIKISEEFLRWLFDFLKTQICPGTQYQRNTLAFKILLLMLESGIDDTTPVKYLDAKNLRKYPFSIRFFEDGVLLRLLIDNLTSNYDDIRQASKRLLTIALDNEESSSLHKEFDWKKIQQQATEYMEVYQNTETGAALQDFLFSTSPDKIMFVNNLLDELQAKIDESKKDYLKHHYDPVGGYFAALTLLLKNDDFSYDTSNDIVNRCLSLILSNWDAVKEPVCCHPTEVRTSEEYLKDGIKDQFLVAKAFRSIKESSALLEVLITRPSITFKQLTSAGDLLICQLFDLRHSGAFQSVLPSFNACCNKCSENYPKQLKTWLQVVINSLEVKTQMVTRRSGGIPYLLTTILAAERGKERPLLKLAFEKLEIIASLPITQYQDEVDLPQVNAFNCIRSIFIESKLAEPCAPYVASALNLALKNFISEIWPLRNCSIMLFTSLQNRIFGKAGKSISARLFFTRFGGVQELLLDVLKESLRESSNTNNPVLSQSGVESIFLVLNLLLRLQPTPGFNGLEVFTNETFLCLESANWNIREMAAKTMTSLTDDYCTQCEVLMKGVSIKSQNRLHGHLLAVKSILENNKEFVEDDSVQAKLFELVYAQREALLTFNSCFATAKAYIEVLELFVNLKHIKRFNAKRNTILSLLGHFFILHNERYSIDGMKQLCLAVALRMLLKHADPENIADLCQLGILSSFQEVQSVAIQFVVDNVDLSRPDNKAILTELKRSFAEEKTLPTLKSLILRALQGTSNGFSLEELANLIKNPNNEELQLGAIEALGYLVDRNDTKVMDSMVVEYTQDDVPADFRMSALVCLTNFLKRHPLPHMLLQVHKMLNDDDEDVRKIAAKFLSEHFYQKSYVMSPSVAAGHFGEVFSAKYIDQPDAAEYVVHNVMRFWDSYDISTPTCTSIEGLFEVEKDNQFRNQLEENVQYLNILKKLSFHSNELSCWLDDRVELLMDFLRDSQIIDGPLGWASSSEVFPRLCVFWKLVNIYGASRVTELEGILKDRNVHPLIFDYLFVDY